MKRIVLACNGEGARQIVLKQKEGQDIEIVKIYAVFPNRVHRRVTD